jgi:transcriptional regulator with XRE-family HTH domain
MFEIENRPADPEKVKLITYLDELERRQARKERKDERTCHQRDIGLGYLIWAARRFRGINKVDLARKIGASPAAMSRWEAGTRVPSYLTLQTIGDECGLDLVIGLRSRKDGEFVVLGECFDEGPMMELRLLADRYENVYLPPAKWRAEVERMMEQPVLPRKKTRRTAT